MHGPAKTLLLAGVIWAIALPIVHVAVRGSTNHAYATPYAQPGRDSAAADDSSEAPSCEPFDVRVGLGKAAEQNEEFSAYQSSMNRQVGSQYAAAMRSCFATVKDPQTDSFTLVGDITPDGELSAVEVRPATNIASCFAAGLRAVTFPNPPRYSGRNGFPVTIEMHITE
jgi:hypothetical protein